MNDPVDRFCGSFKLFSAADGAPIHHDQCWMALALRDDRGYNGQEILVERPDGTRLTALAHANPIRDEAGRVVGAVNVVVDISERKRTFVAQSLLAASVESSEDAIVSKTLEQGGQLTLRPFEVSVRDRLLRLLPVPIGTCVSIPVISTDACADAHDPDGPRQPRVPPDPPHSRPQGHKSHGMKHV